MKSGTLNINLIQEAMKGGYIGKHIDFKTDTTSTNDEVWSFAQTDTFDGLVVFADAQSAGRGRRGRLWQSPRGASLLLSLGISGQDHAMSGEWLSIVMAIAVHETVARSGGIRPTIKWPNDVLVNGQKLSGILVESRQNQTGSRDHVVGIGINCLQHRGHFSGPLADTATSLELLSCHPIDRTAVAIHLLQAINKRLSRPETLTHQKLRSEWLNRTNTLGARVVLEREGRRYSGTVIDLDPMAALVLQLDEGGIRAFNAANTSLVSTECDS